MEMIDINVGDIIDGRRVTKVFELCGGIAYQSEPVVKKDDEFVGMNMPEPVKEEEPEEKPKRGRRKKEA